MLIIIDRNIPAEAKEKLVSEISGISEQEIILLELQTTDLVYPAISGHPDIFFFKTQDHLIVAPNLPQEYLNILDQHKIPYLTGNRVPGTRKHHSTYIHYNAAAGERHLVHRLEYTDPVILEHCHFLKKIPVKQGYSACNLLFLKEDHYITSDVGIDRALQAHGLSGLYVDPEGIVLPGFRNGFIAGAMGVYHDHVFITGSLSHFPQGEKVRNYLNFLGYEIHELYDGPLFDGGGIIVMKNESAAADEK
ncbi:MAG: DUF6873 family GME fold protein [Syntrophothermus sp.]